MTTTPPMKVMAIAPWFGGKRTLAPKIVEQLGQHTAYWEPFCGGLSIIASKPKSRQECVNDLHGDLINLARVVQDDNLSPSLFERLVRTLPHEDELARARALTVEQVELPIDAPPDLERAAAFFIVSWLGRSGESGLAKCERASRICVRWKANGGDPATRFRNAIESIPAWWQRLRGVTILRRDAFDILGRISDEPGTAIYIDPPYLVKSDKYLHDFDVSEGSMFGDDHDRLAKLLHRFDRARVVVSYYADERVESLYSRERWTHIDCAMAKNLSHQGSGGVSRAPEVLIVNGPAYGAEAAP